MHPALLSDSQEDLAQGGITDIRKAITSLIAGISDGLESSPLEARGCDTPAASGGDDRPGDCQWGWSTEQLLKAWRDISFSLSSGQPLPPGKASE